MPDETIPAALDAAPATRSTARPGTSSVVEEPRVPTARLLDLAPHFARELNRPVTRGTVAGALHRLERERKSHMPKTLSRSEMAAAITVYLDSEEV